MAEFPKALQHPEASKKTDDQLEAESRAHLAGAPALQVVAELLLELRSRRFPWWKAEQLRELFSSTDRMLWYDERPDLRQQITTILTGLVPRAARKKIATFQAELLDSAIDDGDIGCEEFDTAFEAHHLAVYGPASEFWRAFRARMPFGENVQAHQELMTWLLKALVTEKSGIDGMTRKPILTPWELRTAIPGKAWHTHIPIEIRVAIDEARFRMEKSGQPFQVIHELSIAVPKVLTSNLPLEELVGVLDVAERAMGIEGVKAAPVAGKVAEVFSKPVEKAVEKPGVKAPEKAPEKPVETAKAVQVPAKVSAAPARPMPGVKAPPPATPERKTTKSSPKLIIEGEPDLFSDSDISVEEVPQAQPKR